MDSQSHSHSDTQPGEYLIDLNYFSSKINNKYIGTNQIIYKVINYNKNYVCSDDRELQKYRSVIVAEKGSTTATSHFTQQLLCFAPPKSIEHDVFVQMYPENGGLIHDDICVNEIIEGTMVNLFYDNRNSSWQLATKSSVGANYQYYQYNILEDPNDPKSQAIMTFRDMFMDALNEPQYADINKITLVQNLDKNHCYSFVLQHPQNHFVLPIKHPALYLVAVYEIINNSTSIAKYIPLESVVNWSGLKHPKILFPNEFPKNLSHEFTFFKDKFCSEFSDPHFLGYMLTHKKTGERMAIRNQRYEYIKEIRGNYSHVQYLYLNLLRTGKLDEFLDWFPIYNKMFYKYYTLYKNFVASVHNAYMKKYVDKNPDYVFDSNINYLIKKLHIEIFIPSIKSERVIITRRIVWNYLLNNISPNMVMYYMLRVPLL